MRLLSAHRKTMTIAPKSTAALIKAVRVARSNPCDEVDHDLDFEAGRADAARARSSAAMYRAADERG